MISLPRRQLDVVREIASGSSNEETARALGISVRTVEMYLVRAHARLGTRGRAHLVAVSLALGLIRPEEIRIPRRNA